jgi:hypothetical protein
MNRIRTARAVAAAVTAMLVAACTATPSTSTSSPPTTEAPTVTASPSASASPPTWPIYRPLGTIAGMPALWPLSNSLEAIRFARSNPAPSAWQRSASQTALRFTRTYLGFTDITTVIAVRFRGARADLDVGYLPTSASINVAATIELRRWADLAGAPWEVVGATTKGLSASATLGPPSSGIRPLTVTGLITGVDESIGIDVRLLSHAKPIAVSCCLAAGGQSMAWRRTVSVPLAPPVQPSQSASVTSLSVITHTGGHLQAVERFTVTGVLVD